MQARDVPDGLSHKKNGNVMKFYIPVIYEVTTGFEPVVRELQSLALPLGYVTIIKFC